MTQQVLSGKGAIHFSFRKSSDSNHSEQILLIGCWESKADHDDLDIRGLTPKILKVLLARLKPVGVYFMYIDASAVDLDRLVGVKAYHVKDGQKSSFQKVVDTQRIAGAWSVIKPAPPLPTQMPTDPFELGIIEQQRAQAEEVLKEPHPDIWVSFISPGMQSSTEEFDQAVSQDITIQ